MYIGHSKKNLINFIKLFKFNKFSIEKKSIFQSSRVHKRHYYVFWKFGKILRNFGNEKLNRYETFNISDFVTRKKISALGRSSWRSTLIFYRTV